MGDCDNASWPFDGRPPPSTQPNKTITGRFDAKEIDLVVFGGQVPPDRKTELREEIGALNPRVIFVEGLAGIPGLIVHQVQGAFRAEHQDPPEHQRTRPRSGRSG
jgi:hypothetical protein